MNMVDFISRIHGIEPIDYARGEKAALLCAGSGLMMGIMDACPGLRWCIDVDGLDRDALDRLPDWAACLGNTCELVALVGWFSVSDPTPLAEAARVIRPGARLVYAQCWGKTDPFAGLRTAGRLGELIEQVNARLAEKKGPMPRWCAT